MEHQMIFFVSRPTKLLGQIQTISSFREYFGFLYFLRRTIVGKYVGGMAQKK